MFGSKRFMALGLVLLLVVTAVGGVWANELDQQLNDVQQQIEVQQNKVNKAQRQVDSVADQLRVVQTELDVANGEYNDVRSKLAYTEQQIELNTSILAKAEKDLVSRSNVLNRRMRDVYENGQVSYLEVLLGSADFGDFTTRMDILKRVLNQDVTLIAKIKAERQLIITKKAELEQDRAAVLELKKVAEEKRSLIQQRKQERQAVLDTAVNQRDVAERAYNELQETSRQIERMIRSQSGRQSMAAGATGAMIWPAEGPITSPYGWRTHPIFGTQRYHSGIDIGADYGDTVLAADGGVVIYSDWMGGYGKAVIIDHGSGISTLYGHNSELLVSEGQRVRKGQPISKVGSTGYSTGPHLHFEVRENGSPSDPMRYLQ